MVDELISVCLIVSLITILGVGFRLNQAYRSLGVNTKTLGNRQQPALGTDLPSITVCIPARNERHSLSDCLDKVLASDYEKLEIVVYDDVSGDDTSALIKSYASEGVRFVAGIEPPKGWLGKPYALQGLLNQASGSYILFIDVDTRLKPDSISIIVEKLLSLGSSMMSVIPIKEDGLKLSALFSPLRYMWELLFSSKAYPATSSSAWLINRRILKHELSGFNRYSMSVQPEFYLASELSKTNRYQVILGNQEIGISYQKKWLSLLESSVRLIYPSFRKNFALLILFVLNILILLAPFVVLLLTPIIGTGYNTAIAILTAMLSLIIYGQFLAKLRAKNGLVGLIFWPVVLIQEIILAVISFVQYFRGRVTWKGRSIRPEA